MIHILLYDHHDISEKVVLGAFDNRKQAEDAIDRIEELFPDESESKEPFIISLEMNDLNNCFIRSEYQFMIKDPEKTIVLFDKEIKLAGYMESSYPYCYRIGHVLYVFVYENIISYNPKSCNLKAQEVIRENYKAFKNYSISNI